MRKPILLLCLLLWGCGGGNTDKGNAKAGATGLAAAVVPNVRVITLAGLRHMIRDRNGKRLLMNVWATWCVPCQEELPDIEIGAVRCPPLSSMILMGGRLQ